MITDVSEEPGAGIFKVDLLSYPETGDRKLLRNLGELFTRLHDVIFQKTGILVIVAVKGSVLTRLYFSFASAFVVCIGKYCNGNMICFILLMRHFHLFQTFHSMNHIL
jgi:hypothetical protein